MDECLYESGTSREPESKTLVKGWSRIRRASYSIEVIAVFKRRLQRVLLAAAAHAPYPVPAEGAHQNGVSQPWPIHQLGLLAQVCPWWLLRRPGNLIRSSNRGGGQERSLHSLFFIFSDASQFQEVTACPLFPYDHQDPVALND